MTKRKAEVICPIFENSKYPYHGIGVKVGDPVALTYKYYHNDRFAFVLDGGSAASGLYSTHHRESFQDNLTADLSAIDGLRYVRHIVNYEYVFDAKLLYQTKAERLFPGLQSYIGLGFQYRDVELEYVYFFEVVQTRERETGEFISQRSSFGITGNVGLEYSYFKIPVSAFIELSLFNELSGRSFNKIQGGVGIRYVF